MGKGLVAVYNLGEEGVNVSKSPIHLRDGELLQAQNAIFNPDGELGGLSKRGGLQKINAVAAGGAIRSMVHLPLPNPDDKTRTLWVAIGPQDGGTTRTWRKSTNLGSSWSDSDFPQLNQPVITGLAYHNQRIVTYRQKMYYPQKVVSTNPVIRVWDGTNEYPFVEIPTSPAASGVANGVLDMILHNGTIYLSVYDPGGAAPNHKGRVFSLSPETGVLTEIGNRFGNGAGENTGGMPYCLTFYNGFLWAGTYGISGSAVGKVYKILPGVETTWTLDHTTATSQGYILALLGFQGNLYAATSGDASFAALVKKRTPAGVWTTSDTGIGTTGGSGYEGLFELGGELYAPFLEAGGANVIRKFNGSAWSTDVDVYVTFGGSSVTGHFGQPLILNSIVYLPLVFAGTGGQIRKVIKKSGGSWSAIDDLGTADGFRGSIGYIDTY